MIFMQYVSQFDKYFLTTFHFEIFQLAKEKNYTKEQLEEYLNMLFTQLKNVAQIIDQMNVNFDKHFKSLSKFDIEGKLKSDEWKYAFKENFYGNYNVVNVYLKTFDIMGKVYENHMPLFLND